MSGSSSGDELADGVGRDDGVGVDADVELFSEAVEGEVERGGALLAW